MYAKLNKCEFWLQVTFLGYAILRKCVLVDKVEVVMRWDRLKNALERFNRCYHGGFVEGFSILVVPLTRFMCKDFRFEWGDKCENSFRS